MFPLDHIGIAVTDIESAIVDYANNFGFSLHSREIIESQKVEIAFVSLENTLIELLSPTDPKSPLTKFLNSRGPGLHHICYRVTDITAELERFKSLGHTLIDEKPRSGAHNSLIAFIHPKTLGGVLTELCQHIS